MPYEIVGSPLVYLCLYLSSHRRLLFAGALIFASFSIARA